MKHPTSKTLYSYWNELRGSRPAPRRFEVEPSRLAAILPDTFILERLDAGIYRYRLGGTRLCELFGTELRGQNFLAGWDRADREALSNRLSCIASHAAVGVFEFEAWGQGRRAVRLECLIVPLLQAGAAIDRFLGALSPLDEPDWLGREPLRHRLLLNHELVWPDGTPQAAGPHRPVLLPHVRDARLVRVDRRSFRVYDGGLSRSSREEQ
jgi:hypothetical protein